MRKNFHLALIPDGNRRWAKKKRIFSWLGHKTGAKTLEKILEKAWELKIPYFTFWAGSFDNLTKRRKKEIDFLFQLYHNSFERLLKEKKIYQEKVRLRVLGRWSEILPLKTKKIIEKLIAKTKNYDQYNLTFLLAYNGTDEILACFQKIADLAFERKIKITPHLIKENLWTEDLPAVDLVIRTGCQEDPHNSTGFLMWDTAYAQFHFSQTLFPDFQPAEFSKIINQFLKRKRRFGK